MRSKTKSRWDRGDCLVCAGGVGRGRLIELRYNKDTVVLTLLRLRLGRLMLLLLGWAAAAERMEQPEAKNRECVSA